MDMGCYTYKCSSIYPSVTYSCHASIITGVYPSKHGIVGNSFYDKLTRKRIDFDIEDPNNYLETDTLFSMLNEPSIAVAEPISHGATTSIPKSDIESNPIPNWDAIVFDKAIELIYKYLPRVSVVNLPGIDKYGEIYGPTGDETIRHIEEIDTYINRYIEVLTGLYEDFLLIITADHGMTDVETNLDLKELLKELGCEVHVSHRMAHIYIFNQKDMEIILHRLKDTGGIDKVFTKHRLKLYGLDNERAGDIIVFAQEGFEFSHEVLKGSHGGVSKDEMKVPLIISKPEYVDLLRGDIDITIIPSIIRRYLRERDVIDFVKERLVENDPGHDWGHTKRVLDIATDLSIRYKSNIEAVRLSALFHDIDRGIEPYGHEVRAAQTAEKYLSSKGASRELVETVKRIILMHHKEPTVHSTYEEMILWDADKLDALGVIGLFRCLLIAGFYRHEYKDALNHFIDDTISFGVSMHFDETRRIASQRIKWTIEFLEKLASIY